MCKPRYYMRFVAFYILLIISINSYSQTQRALLIGISNYKSYKYNSAWSNINGTNDVKLIEKDLKLLGFNYVTTFLDKEATASNVRKGLRNLISSSKKGDIVYFHFSGHGQPVLDVNGDEGKDDGWDESVIPYDAEMFYKPGVYDGKNHIVDDELGLAFDELRKRVGQLGMVYVVIDACYSGTGIRGDEDENYFSIDDDAPLRGVNVGFDFGRSLIYEPKVVKTNRYLLKRKPGRSDIIVLEACLPYQQNREIKVKDTYYGPLSYYVHEVIKNKNITRQTSWIGNVINLFNTDKRTFRQKIVCESSINNGKGY